MQKESYKMAKEVSKIIPIADAEITTVKVVRCDGAPKSLQELLPVGASFQVRWGYFSGNKELQAKGLIGESKDHHCGDILDLQYNGKPFMVCIGTTRNKLKICGYTVPEGMDHSGPWPGVYFEEV